MLASLALLLTCVALPAVGNNRKGSEQAVCVNNLRQIGQAFQLWAANNGEMYIWRLLTPAGTANHPMRSQLWVHFSYMSNELATPRFLACPADRTTRVALFWGVEYSLAYLNANNQNNATSYFLGLHAQPDYPQSILAGDRNLRVDSVGGFCVTGIPNPAQVYPNNPFGRTWSAAVHGESGNLLLSSGAVLQLSNLGLATAMTNSASPFSDTLHLLFPKRPELQQ